MNFFFFLLFSFFPSSLVTCCIYSGTVCVWLWQRDNLLYYSCCAVNDSYTFFIVFASLFVWTRLLSYSCYTHITALWDVSRWHDGKDDNDKVVCDCDSSCFRWAQLWLPCLNKPHLTQITFSSTRQYQQNAPVTRMFLEFWPMFLLEWALLGPLAGCLLTRLFFLIVHEMTSSCDYIFIKTKSIAVGLYGKAYSQRTVQQ